MGRSRNPLIKKANAETEYTFDQIQDLKKCRKDPIYFIKNFCRIQHPVKGAILFDLYDYQEDMIRAFTQHTNNIVLSSRQTGKAVRIDTRIPTPEGWTTMEQIQVGDRVIGADGKPATVKWTSDIHVPEVCYRIYFSTGETVDASADHQWEIEWKHKHGPQVVTTQQMVDAGVINGNKNESRFEVRVTNPIDLPEKDLPIDPYTLGVWLGNGHSASGRITLHENDCSILEWLPYDTKQHMYDHQPGIATISVYGLTKQLRELGVQNNKHIPVSYLRSSRQQRFALLQGLMDTDGTVDGMGKGQCDITLSTKTLASDVFHLVSSLGIKATFRERIVNNFVRYEIKFSVYRDEYPVFRLERKLRLMKQSSDPSRRFSTKKRSIQKIERIDSVPMKCIGVDNTDNLFLLGESCIPTHNSTIASMYLLWFAIFNFDKTVLIASNKNKGAMEMIARIQYAYQYLPEWLKPGVPDDGWNKHSIKFDNDSRIESEATSDNSGRGMSISLLYLDEFAFVKQAIANEFWTSIAPTLATGGGCIISSTPNGDSNIFAQLWRGAQVDANGFFPTFVPWWAPPGRDEKFKENEIGRIGERRWRQEYECEFLTSDALLFDAVALANLTKTVRDATPTHKIREVQFWKHPQKDKTYLVGVDPSTGTGNDFTVIEIFEFPSMEQVGEFRSNTMSSATVYPILKNILRYLEQAGGTVYFSVENNGVGEGIIALYEADEDPPQQSEFLSETGKDRLGMTTTGKSKLRACLDFKELFEGGNIKIYSPILAHEMKEFSRKANSYQARAGSTDDCISAVLIITRILREMSSFEQEAYEALHTVEDDHWTEEDYDDSDEPPPMII